jgi:hypothetical protein
MIKTIFAPDYARYDGVRPINIYLLRLLYFLMAAFVATEAWTTLITHRGPWDPVRAVAWCVWAAYPTMSVLGLIHPLRMLPIMVFMIFYKSLWVIVVAFPLWKTGTLVGSPAEEMARVFIWAPVLALAVPWKYVFRHFVLPSKRTPRQENVIHALGHQPAAGD